MLPTPTKFTLCAGASDGSSPLNAFDNALLEAGIGNANLVRVSSILPAGVSHVPELKLSPGALTPVAYGTINSDVPEEKISAAVAVGISLNSFGVIMEYSGRCGRQDAEAKVVAMVQDAFKIRDLELIDVMVKAAEHTVVRNGSAFAAVALWY
ncbi:MAG: arginine decarboxylase, pyruvoyl-dependent [Firmicutes bacterium]|nr:arginine decarboxylase, pyruvoyl-dependent [Bacillota bacterium]